MWNAGQLEPGDGPEGPDEDLLRALERRRGRGRDDYPIRAMWRALVAGIVFQHVSVESLLRELRRNPALLDVCGFDPMGPWRRAKGGGVGGSRGKKRDGVPSAWNFSRFLTAVVKLEEKQGGIDDAAREQLMEEVEDRGASGLRREGGSVILDSRYFAPKALVKGSTGARPI